MLWFCLYPFSSSGKKEAAGFYFQLSFVWDLLNMQHMNICFSRLDLELTTSFFLRTMIEFKTEKPKDHVVPVSNLQFYHPAFSPVLLLCLTCTSFTWLPVSITFFFLWVLKILCLIIMLNNLPPSNISLSYLDYHNITSLFIIYQACYFFSTLDVLFHALGCIISYESLLHSIILPFHSAILTM